MRHRLMTHPLFFISIIALFLYLLLPLSFLFAAAEQNQALLFGDSE